MKEQLKKLTPSERVLLWNMFDEGFATDDWDNDFMSWGVSGRKERGVLSSLVKKGIVNVGIDGNDRPVYLCQGYNKREIADVVGYKHD